MWNETWTDRLKQDLFVKYDKFARPMQHYNTTVVSFDITILHVDVASMRYIRTRLWENRRETTIGLLPFFRMNSSPPSPSTDGLPMWVSISHSLATFYIISLLLERLHFYTGCARKRHLSALALSLFHSHIFLTPTQRVHLNNVYERTHTGTEW